MFSSVCITLLTNKTIELLEKIYDTCNCCGSKNRGAKKDKVAVKGGNMGATFGVFSVITTIAIFCAIYSTNGIFKSIGFLVAAFMIMFAYYLLDTLAIVKGKYTRGG